MIKCFFYISLSLLFFNFSLANDIDIQEDINLSFVCDLEKKILKNSEYNYQTFLAKDLDDKDLDKFDIEAKKPETLLISGLSLFLSDTEKLNVKIVNKDVVLFKAIERFMLPALQIVLPEIQDINMPAEGVFHNLVIVSVKKEYPGHTRKIMNAMWGLGLLMLAKTIIVVDDFVNVHNLSEVAWRVTSNIDPVHDVIFSDGPVDDLDHASRTPKIGSKMGIDATIKGKEDGRLREWPPDVLMDPTIKKMVDDRWHEYGFPSI